LERARAASPKKQLGTWCPVGLPLRLWEKLLPAAGLKPDTTWATVSVAALRALATGGPDAVRVEALAVSLGVSKGGFYWHFTDRQALLDDDFYANQDPQVFGRAVVGAVNDAVGYFLTHPGADAESLADSLCRIFAP